MRFATRTTGLAPLALALACATGAAHANGLATDAFSGPLNPANWTLTRTGPVFGSGVNTSGAPASITLTGGNDAMGAGCPDATVSGFVGGCEIRYMIPGAANYSFSWAYSTADITPAYDQFGVVVDGVRTELVANGGDVTQGGSYTVVANSSFGWYINCTDCTFGAATVTLSNLSAVPEAGTPALLAAGLLTLGLLRRRLPATQRG